MNGAVSKKRWLMEIGIGFMLGRVWVFSINPFGLAYLCASGVYPAGRGLVFLSVLAGFITKAKGLDFLHYIMMTGLLWFVQKIMKKVELPGRGGDRRDPERGIVGDDGISATWHYKCSIYGGAGKHLSDCVCLCDAVGTALPFI